MPYLKIDGKEVPLAPGETLIGSGEGAGIRIETNIPGIHASIRVDGQEVALARPKESAGQVRVNGIQLGAEPAALVHGDKIELAGREIMFGDHAKVGSTQHIATVRVPRTEPAEVGVPEQAVATRDGRVVSLVDGREYQVPADGLVIGRDPECDVVVPSTNVSRKHAVIALGARGYVIMDTSTNGLYVNGQSVATSRPLSRGDVIRVGGEEFRFYGETTAETPPATALATLEVVNEGLLKGQRFEIRSALAHAGRGAHNDIVVPDASVSDSHAKFQRRDNGWFIVDMGSTNGTYVGGKRIDGEQALARSADVRLGNVKFVFLAVVQAAPDKGESSSAAQTRVIAPVKAPLSTSSATPLEQASVGERRKEARQKGGKRPPSKAGTGTPAPARTSLGLWILLFVLVAAGVTFLMMSR
ncbi:MAG: FHA domain-containing protein [Gemmatimonadaceae bacterium]